MDSEDHDALKEHEIHIANVSVDGESLDLDTLCTANPLSSWMPRYGGTSGSKCAIHACLCTCVYVLGRTITTSYPIVSPGLHTED